LTEVAHATSIRRCRQADQRRQEITISRDFDAPRKEEGPRLNGDIRCPQVRVVGSEGQMIGIMSTRDALFQAREEGLDLLEISPNADPPVVKILDYGKHKYEQQKKANVARKNQKVVEIKEVKVRPNIDDHDLEVKMRGMRSFLADGDKVKVTLRFRGREMAHQDLGVRLLQRIQTDLGDTIKIEQLPKMEMRQLVMVLAPR
jgi:translation initiation factor IF-3